MQDRETREDFLSFENRAQYEKAIENAMKRVHEIIEQPSKRCADPDKDMSQ
jgi:hypothetical protein